MNKNLTADNHIVVFKDNKIRRVFHEDAWWFVVTDVIAALTDSNQPLGYLKDMRRRDSELAKGWGQIATPLLVETPGGTQKLNCANTEGIFRIIQSIATFGMTPSEYKQYKELKRENLRDHMTDLARIPNSY